MRVVLHNERGLGDTQHVAGSYGLDIACIFAGRRKHRRSLRGEIAVTEIKAGSEQGSIHIRNVELSISIEISRYGVQAVVGKPGHVLRGRRSSKGSIAVALIDSHLS